MFADTELLKVRLFMHFLGTLPCFASPFACKKSTHEFPISLVNPSSITQKLKRTKILILWMSSFAPLENQQIGALLLIVQQATC